MGFCAAPSVFAQAPGANPKAAPTSIALVDVGYLLKNHPNMNANMEAIKAEMTAAQEDIESRRTALLKDQESIGKTFEPDSPQFKQKQESLISAESKLRVDFMGKEKEFAEKQATVIFNSYQSINRAIKLMADFRQHDIVLRYSREQDQMDPKKPQSVNFGVQRDVLYHNPAVDITESVLAVLVRDEPKATGPAAASTPSPQAQAPRAANGPQQPGLRRQ